MVVNNGMSSLAKNKTCVVGPRENVSNILTNKWGFHRKEILDQNGLLQINFKARLDTCGFQQTYGIEYWEAFEAVIKFKTLRLMLATVASDDLKLHQMDIITAFLNRDLSKNIFMEQLEGVVDSKKPANVCKLETAFYGRKQTPRQWLVMIDTFSRKYLQFQRYAYDSCFYGIRETIRYCWCPFILMTRWWLEAPFCLLFRSGLPFVRASKWRTAIKQDSARELKFEEIV